MKAAYCAEGGGPEVLRYGDVPEPTLAPDEVLIRVEAISIEGGDILNRRRSRPGVAQHVVGYQAAGTIEAVGAEVASVHVGQRVVGQADQGSHAEVFAAPAARVFPVPDGLDIGIASTLPVTFGTAHDALFEFGGLKPGETVLVQGAAGGVGIACVQLAKQAGATVIGTARGADRIARLGALGLDHGIDYAEEDIGQRCRELTDGRGVDLVVDMAGGRNLTQVYDAMRYRGRFAAVGLSSGEMPVFTFSDLLSKNLTIIGVFLAREIHTPRVHALVDAMMRDVLAGRLTMPIDREFALADAAAAHAHVETGHPLGRVLMRP